MNKLKKTQYGLYASIMCIVLVVSVAFIVGVNAFIGDSQPTTVIENATIQTFNEAPKQAEQMVGAVTGPNIYASHIGLYGHTMIGGEIFASSTLVAATALNASQLINYKQLDYTVRLANTLTLPASSTLQGIWDGAGNCFTFKIRNVTATAASSTTIAAGTGMDLVEIEGGDVVIEGGNEALLTLCRELDSDITVSVDEYVAAD